jgi:signal transduction histidine kinase/CheY-like chemotaxis protein
MNKLRVLYLEDNPSDVILLRHTLEAAGLDAEVNWVADPAAYHDAIRRAEVDVILTDSGLPGFDGHAAIHAASLDAGVAEFVPKSEMDKVADAIRRATAPVSESARIAKLERHNRAMTRLVQAVQDLSLAHDLETIMAIVRRAARELTGADGATFVLREGENCHYADEDAIAPLWKGKRFPLETCISGWAMLHRQPAVIEDIYADKRIPADAYRPTFVKSLAMVPIRTAAPIGAIGNYWAHRHQPTPEEVEVLQALANTTAVAMENVQVYSHLEQRVKDRTVELEAANRELESFSYSVAHDLRAPLRAITGFSSIVSKKYAGKLDEQGADYLARVQTQASRMGVLIDDLLKLSRFSRSALNRSQINMSKLAQGILLHLRSTTPERDVTFKVQEGVEAEADPVLMGVVLENLLSNAWKYTSKQTAALIEFGRDAKTGTYFVRDNGAGFDMKLADKLFAPFQRLHTEAEFPGHGIGLATVQRIIHRHGGRIRAESEPGKGAAFYFTLG